jgi:signal transduction histidine kinase
MDFQRESAVSFPVEHAESATARDVDTIYCRQSRPRTAFAQQEGPNPEVLAMVCHELRSPLASVRYALRLFVGTQAQEVAKRQQLQALMERQTVRMTQIIDDLLDVSRMKNERLQLHCERLDLRTTVGHAIDTLASEMDVRRHQVTMSAPDRPVWVTGDAARLEQVFVNLLANAAKYTGHSGQIAIRIHPRESEVIVRIRDSGIGIAPQMLPHVFELFRQAGEPVSQIGSGLGIGLAIVRNLVELHGGSVTATSRGIGHGSEFIVCLPGEG